LLPGVFSVALKRQNLGFSGQALEVFRGYFVQNGLEPFEESICDAFDSRR